ncbi:kinase-like domain-containing protein [Pisolithus marmoratus]|nr:kinase-like domain-containing protein [Pisolithus marmoratus]
MTHTTQELKQLSGWASPHGINLDEDVIRDLTNRYVRGNHAVVFQGTLRRTGSRVAIKVLRSGPPEDEAAVKRVLTEVKLWSQLDHENVLPILGITTKYDLTVSLVIKWIERGNAHAYVQDPTVDPRPLLLGIARGLQYLHEYQPKPVVHGGSKEYSNVLISEQGHALLTDYGLPNLLYGSFSMTVSAPSLSALNWTAPEILSSEDQEVTIPGDVWGFGMTALELFTRQVPFSSFANFQSLKRGVSGGPPERPDADCTYGRMTDEWWLICTSCWRIDASSRPNASSLVAAVERVLESMRKEHVSPSTAESPGHVAVQEARAESARSITVGDTESQALKVPEAAQPVVMFPAMFKRIWAMLHGIV